MTERGSHSGYGQYQHLNSNGYRYWEPTRGPGRGLQRGPQRGYRGPWGPNRFKCRPYYKARGNYKSVSRENLRERLEKSRPSSPVEGSEEFTKLKIENTSAFIMRQLLSSDEIVVNSPKLKDQDTSTYKKEEKAISTSSSKKSKPVRKQRQISTRSNEDAQNLAKYNFEEIRHKILNHITNINNAKKKNLINAEALGYDETSKQTQRQRILQISRAFRSMCGDSVDEATAKESNTLINSIIYDVGIKIEDLPIDVIRTLRDTLGLDQEDSFKEVIRPFTSKKSKPVTKQRKNSTRSNEDDQNLTDYTFQEIHHKIMNHITNMNDGRKKNLINAEFSGYDVAIRQIQRQKRLQISRAFRSMCGDSVDEDTTKESSNLINSIIPDVGIKIEDLPIDVIRTLRDTLDLDEEDDSFFPITNSYQYYQDVGFENCEIKEEKEDKFSRLSEDIEALLGSQPEKDNFNADTTDLHAVQSLNKISPPFNNSLNQTSDLIRQESPPVQISTENVANDFELSDFNHIEIKLEPVDEHFDITNEPVKTISRNTIDKSILNINNWNTGENPPISKLREGTEIKSEPLDEYFETSDVSIKKIAEKVIEKDKFNKETLIKDTPVDEYLAISNERIERVDDNRMYKSKETVKASDFSNNDRLKTCSTTVLSESSISKLDLEYSKKRSSTNVTNNGRESHLGCSSIIGINHSVESNNKLVEECLLLKNDHEIGVKEVDKFQFPSTIHIKDKVVKEQNKISTKEHLYEIERVNKQNDIKNSKKSMLPVNYSVNSEINLNNSNEKIVESFQNASTNLCLSEKLVPPSKSIRNDSEFSTEHSKALRTSLLETNVEMFFDNFKSKYGSCDTSDLSSVVDKMHFIDQCVEKLTDFRRSLFHKLIEKDVCNKKAAVDIEGESSESKKRKLYHRVFGINGVMSNSDKECSLQDDLNEEKPKKGNTEASRLTHNMVLGKKDGGNFEEQSSLSFMQTESSILNISKESSLQDNSNEEKQKNSNTDANNSVFKKAFDKGIQEEHSDCTKTKLSESIFENKNVVLNTDKKFQENSDKNNRKKCYTESGVSNIDSKFSLQVNSNEKKRKKRNTNANSSTYAETFANLSQSLRVKCHSNLIENLLMGVAGRPEIINKVDESLNNINASVKKKRKEKARFYDIKFSFIGIDEKVTQIKRHDHQIFLATDRGQIYVCNLNSGTLVNTVQNGDGVITCLAILGQSKLYVGASSSLKIYCLKTLKLHKVLEIFPEDKIQCMELQIPWEYLFVGCINGTLMRFSIKKEASEYQDKSMNNIQAMKATQEGPRKVLIVGNKNAPICIRDALSGLILRLLSNDVVTTTYSLIFHRNLVFCGTTNQSILVFKYQEGTLFNQMKVASKGISCMEQFKNLLFAGCTDGSIYVYQYHKKEKKNLNLIYTKKIKGGSILCMAILPKQIIVKTMTNPVQSIHMPKEVMTQIEYF